MNERILTDKAIRQLRGNLSFYFSEKLERLLAKPQWVFISLSHQCTYACKMCEVVKILKGYELEMEIVKDCIDTIAKWENDCMVTMTGGEAFLRKDVFEIFDYSLTKKVPIEVVSNGALIDQDMACKIMASGLKNIAISLDGAKADTHDAIRKPGSFQKAIDAIKYLALAKQHVQKGPQISVWTTIMKQNVNELADIIELVRGLRVECLVYHPVIAAQDDMQNTSAASPFWISGEKTLGILKSQI
ncbi:MAG: radical SAM protein, partial [Candidatus Omnitrophica bacterium]|nr:radical SAM protein [Candidatus Omnitrophota bacterium]